MHDHFYHVSMYTFFTHSFCKASFRYCTCQHLRYRGAVADTPVNCPAGQAVQPEVAKVAVRGSHCLQYKTMLPRSSLNCSSQTCKNQEGMGHKLQQFALNPQFVNIERLSPCFCLPQLMRIAAMLHTHIQVDSHQESSPGFKTCHGHHFHSTFYRVPACSSAFAKTWVSLLTTEEAAAIAISTSRKYTDLQPCGNDKLMMAATMGASILKHSCLILSPRAC